MLMLGDSKYRSSRLARFLFFSFLFFSPPRCVYSFTAVLCLPFLLSLFRFMCHCRKAFFVSPLDSPLIPVCYFSFGYCQRWAGVWAWWSVPGCSVCLRHGLLLWSASLLYHFISYQFELCVRGCIQRKRSKKGKQMLRGKDREKRMSQTKGKWCTKKNWQKWNVKLPDWNWVSEI